MATESEDVSRRALLKQAAGGAGIVAGTILAGPESCRASAAVETVAAKDAWFAERAFCVSGNRLLGDATGGAVATTRARAVYRPRSAEEIAATVRSAPPGNPIGCVCGGHESSNAALIASDDAIVLDLAHFKGIDFHQEDGRPLVTVGAGVVFRELVEAVKGRHGALPVGTGPGVGVVGYVVNGGLSGYFTRRLGLLGQRVVKLTMVTAAGDVRVLTPADELFTAMLGAGSALGIVVDVTLELDAESILRSAEQRVVAFETRAQAVAFAREAMRLQRERVLPDDAVSMEIVVTGTKAVVVTLVFYDTFTGDPAAFVGPLEALAARLKLPVVMAAQWSSWYEAAAALWPVIAQMKGSPLAMLQHSMGTEGPPSDAVLDRIADTVVAEAPLDEAPFSIVEIRTLGGAALAKGRLPTGNCRHRFFVDLITMYDAKDTSRDQRRAIAARTAEVIERARRQDGLTVDFSGTHSQPDDPGVPVAPAVIFGSAAMAATVGRLKRQVDPANRFRFHPYARIL